MLTAFFLANKRLDPLATESKLPPLLDCPFEIPSCDEIQNAALKVPHFNIPKDDLIIAA
jgi:hypothetical protein